MRLTLFFVILWILLALRVLATLSPASWLWGIDSLADRQAAYRLIGLLLLAAAAIPSVGRSALRFLERLPKGRSRWILSVGASLVAVALLAALRSNNILLGDSQTWLSALEKGVRSAGGAHREPLPQAIVSGIHQLLSRSAGWDAHASFTVVGIVLGLGFFLFAARLGRQISDSLPGRALVFSAIVLGGGVQLFAGYPEFYGFAAVSVLLFAWLGLRSLDGSSGPLPATLAFILAGLCHAQVAFAFPAVLFLLARSWRQGRRRESLIAFGAIPIITAIALWLLRYPFAEIGKEASRAAALLPPMGAMTPRTAYGVLSGLHLLDLLNVLLLVSPALPAIVALGLGGWGSARPRRIFLALLAAGPAIFAILANPELGMVRDWDIFVLPILLLTLWAAAAAAEWIDRRGGAAASSAIAGAILLTGLLHGLFWIDANHRPEPALERMRRVAGNPGLFGPRSRGETWRYIGSVDMKAGETERAAESYLLAIRSDPDEKMSYRFLAGNRIAAATAAGRSVEEGLAGYHAVLGAGRQRQAYAYMGGTLAALTLGRLDLAVREAVRMIDAEPNHPELLAVWGDLRRLSGETDEARVAYERALARDPAQPRARIGLACVAGIQGDRAGVEGQLRETLRRTPWSPQAQQFAREIGESRNLPPEFFRSYMFLQ